MAKELRLLDTYERKWLYKANIDVRKVRPQDGEPENQLFLDNIIIQLSLVRFHFDSQLHTSLSQLQTFFKLLRFKPQIPNTDAPIIVLSVWAIFLDRRPA